MEPKEEYKGENFDTIEGAWEWHSRAVPETVYSPEELEYLMGEQIMLKKDFEEAATRLLSQFNTPLKNESVPVKSAEEILSESANNLGYSSPYDLFWLGADDEGATVIESTVLSCMETYASQFKTNPIEVIKKRIKELEELNLSSDDMDYYYYLKEARNILTIVQL